MAIEAPFLTRIRVSADAVDTGAFPFTALGFLRPGFEMLLDRPVTIFVGENGTGKSTLLEAVARDAGFHRSGGTFAYQLYDDGDGRDDDESDWMAALSFSWKIRARKGFFFRSDRFDGVARYVDDAGDPARYDNRSFRTRSHGEALMAFFSVEMTASLNQRAIYLFDEPEAALSPTRQLAFLKLMHDAVSKNMAQIILVTHSPIMMSFPNSSIYSFESNNISNLNSCTEIETFRLYRRFLSDPDTVLRQLFDKTE